MARGTSHANGRAWRRNRTLSTPAFRLRPPTKRNALLSGTALVAGVLATAMVGLPKPAAAAVCAEGDPNFFTCVGTGETTPDSLTPSGNFAVEFGPGLDPYQLDADSGGPAFTINANGYSSTLAISPNPSPGIALYEGSYIDNASGNGFVLNSASNTGGNSTFNLLVYGRIEGGSAATTGDYRSGDGYRVVGPYIDNVTLTVGENGIIKGADDGLVITQANIKATVDNYGQIVGRGLSNDSANDSEGILVSSNGYKDGKINGAVEINNYGGTISGAANEQQAGNGGGFGVSAASEGDIDIYNGVYGATAGQITGAGGIFAYSSSDVTVKNTGHIAGTTEAGIEISGGGGTREH